MEENSPFTYATDTPVLVTSLLLRFQASVEFCYCYANL